MPRFWAIFGTSPNICSLLWEMLDPTNPMPNGVKGFHLLWGLMVLKLHASKAVHCAISGGVDEKTVCKWSWLFISRLADLAPQVVRASVSVTS
jgi:hypothetical protein